MLSAGIIKVVINTNRIINSAILPETGCRDSGIKNNNINIYVLFTLKLNVVARSIKFTVRKWIVKSGYGGPCPKN